LVDQVNAAEVRIWGQLAGAVLWNDSKDYASFEFDRDFLETGLDLAPIMMPLQRARRGSAIFDFRTLPRDTFRGLPGLLSDSLPDRFGNALINRWLAEQGREPEDFSPVERLCYTGIRGMGALEFKPAIQTKLEESVPVEVSELVRLTQKVLDERMSLKTNLQTDPTDAMLNIIRVGTSAGGNRPKAIIAMNDDTKDILTGQVKAPPDYHYWLLKFDGVYDEGLGDPAGYGRIEYSYYRMARSAGIEMTECRLLEENDRAHFMTRRFDRPGGSKKLHVQSLCGMAHYDFNASGAYSYEQAFQVMRELRLPYNDTEQQYRRLVFNLIARNQDDHTRNIAFIMDKSGRWRLSPAFDVTYSYNPAGLHTNLHQLSVNGKRDEFSRQDLLKVAKEMSIKSAGVIVEQVRDAVSRWPEFADKAGVSKERMVRIKQTHRMNL